MRNFAVKICLFAFSVFVFCAAGANGQACGKYKITINVEDGEGKPLETAGVRFLPITKDETLGKRFGRDEKNRSKFQIEYPEGHSLNKFHKLIVSAGGYKTAENEIKVVSCDDRQIKVRLPKADSGKSPVWEFENSVSLSIKDEKGKYPSGVKISIVKDGKVSETLNLKSYSFGIKNGEYIFRFEKDGYRTEDIKVDAAKIGDVSVEVKLKLKK